MARVEKPQVNVGSQHWMQRLANDPIMSPHFTRALQDYGYDFGNVDWISPLSGDNYAEYSDADYLEALGLHSLVGALSAYWPQGGPNWDGLARGELHGRDCKILLEVKSRVSEGHSDCRATDPISIAQIDAALRDLKTHLKVNLKPDWKSRYYQYANRLAHTYFLRRNLNAKCQVLMVFLYVVNDTTSPGFLTTLSEWKEEIVSRQNYMAYDPRLLRELGVVELFFDAARNEFLSLAEVGVIGCMASRTERRLDELSTGIRAKIRCISNLHVLPYRYRLDRYPMRINPGIMNTLVMPFIQRVLDCDLFDPNEVVFDYLGADIVIMAGQRPFISVIVIEDISDIKRHCDFEHWFIWLEDRIYRMPRFYTNYIVVTDGVKYRFLILNKQGENVSIDKMFEIDLNHIRKDVISPLDNLINELSDARAAGGSRRGPEGPQQDEIDGIISELFDNVGNLIADKTRIHEVLTRYLSDYNFIPGVPGDCKDKLVVWALPPFMGESDTIYTMIGQMCNHLARCPKTSVVYIFASEWPEGVEAEFKRCLRLAAENGVIIWLALVRNGQSNVRKII